MVFGRAVTNVIQTLRNSVEGFDEWYIPHGEAMSRDPLMRFFYKLRSQILKEGQAGLGAKVTLGVHTAGTIGEIVYALGPPPPGPEMRSSAITMAVLGG